MPHAPQHTTVDIEWRFRAYSPDAANAAGGIGTAAEIRALPGLGQVGSFVTDGAT